MHGAQSNRLVLLPFRIAAPATPKHASLQKDDGSYAGTVLYGIPLYVKYSATSFSVVCHGGIPFLDFEKSVSCLGSSFALSKGVFAQKSPKTRQGEQEPRRHSYLCREDRVEGLTKYSTIYAKN
jgi:hypothetical protein